MMSKLSLIVLCLLIVLTVNPSFAQDSWKGGPGNWSNCADWNPGCPGPGGDVLIYSGGNDTVTLDLGTTTINSLMLGGPSNGFTSELTDGGTAQTLNITNALNIGLNGNLYLYGGSTVTASANSSNAGSILVQNGTQLRFNGNVNNSGQVVSGYYGGGGNTLNISGALTNSGYFELYGPSDTATIGSDLTNSGSVSMYYGSTLQINGNLSNSGGINTGFNHGQGGGNTLTITST